MPTGYTAMLDDNPEMTTKQWVMEGLARAFGICVTLRDDSMSLTEEQIRKRIREGGKRDVKWHQKELKKAIEKHEELYGRTKKQWRTVWKKDEAEKVRSNKRSQTKASKLKKRHDQAWKDLETLLDIPTISEVTRNVAQFGIKQLEIVSFECQPHESSPTPFIKYWQSTIDSNVRDIEYHTKHKAKAQERMASRLEGYTQLKKDLELLTGEESK